MQIAAEGQREIHFEVHALRQERWMIDCAAREPAQAIREAKDILREADVAGVRVVKEMWDPETNTAATRVLFSRLKHDDPAASSKRRNRPSAPQAHRPRPAPKPETKPAAAAPKPAPKENGFGAFAVLSLIAGIAASGGVVWLMLG